MKRGKNTCCRRLVPGWQRMHQGPSRDSSRTGSPSAGDAHSPPSALHPRLEGHGRWALGFFPLSRRRSRAVIRLIGSSQFAKVGFEILHVLPVMIRRGTIRVGRSSADLFTNGRGLQLVLFHEALDLRPGPGLELAIVGIDTRVDRRPELVLESPPRHAIGKRWECRGPPGSQSRRSSMQSSQVGNRQTSGLPVRAGGDDVICQGLSAAQSIQ